MLQHEARTVALAGRLALAGDKSAAHKQLGAALAALNAAHARIGSELHRESVKSNGRCARGLSCRTCSVPSNVA